MQTSDRELMLQYAAGTPGAFEAIYAKYASMVYSVCLRWLKRPEDAEDAASICFSVLMRQRNIKGSLGGWLYTCAVYTARRLASQQAHRLQRERTWWAMHEADCLGDKEVHWETIFPRLEAQIAQLPVPQRDAIVLRFYNGLSIADVAEQLQCSEQAIRARLCRALKRLRRKLRPLVGDVNEEVIASGISSFAVVVPAPGSLWENLMRSQTGEFSVITMMEKMVQRMLWTMRWEKVRGAVLTAAAVMAVSGAGVGAWHFAFSRVKEPLVSRPMVERRVRGVRWVDGPVLFADKFTEGLRHWQVMRIVARDRSGQWEMKPVAETNRYARVEEVVREGKAGTVAVIDARDRVLGLQLNVPIEACQEAVSLEWSERAVFSASDGVQRVLFRGVGEPVEGVRKPVSSHHPYGRWVRKRKEFYFGRDEKGQRIVDIRTIKGGKRDVQIRFGVSEDSILFVWTGEKLVVQLADVVMRKMVRHEG